MTQEKWETQGLFNFPLNSTKYLKQKYYEILQMKLKYRSMQIQHQQFFQPTLTSTPIKQQSNIKESNNYQPKNNLPNNQPNNQQIIQSNNQKPKFQSTLITDLSFIL